MLKSPFGEPLMSSGVRSTSVAALLTILVCAVALVLPGCGARKLNRDEAIERYSQDLREAVSNTVPDEGRKAQMLLVVDQLKALHLRFSQETTAFLESYRKLNADYDATRPAFDRLFSDYSTKRIKARNDALELHFQLASLAWPKWRSR